MEALVTLKGEPEARISVERQGTPTPPASEENIASRCSLKIRLTCVRLSLEKGGVSAGKLSDTILQFKAELSKHLTAHIEKHNLNEDEGEMPSMAVCLSLGLSVDELASLNCKGRALPSQKLGEETGT